MATRNGIERWRGEVTAHMENLTTRVDEIHEAIKSLRVELVTALGTHVNDDEKRLSKLEMAQAKFSGKWAVLALGASLILGAVVEAAVRHYVG